VVVPGRVGRVDAMNDEGGIVASGGIFGDQIVEGIKRRGYFKYEWNVCPTYDTKNQKGTHRPLCEFEILHWEEMLKPWRHEGVGS
jgi:hypothetical protein